MSLVTDYIDLGLALGRHVEGMVDAYYGDGERAARAAQGPPVPPAELADRGRRLLASLDSDREMDAARRRWLVGQARGLHTTARRLAGEKIPYLEEIELSYGIRPRYVEEDEFAAAHRTLEEVLPRKGAAAHGSLGERYIAWREAQRVPPDKLEKAVASLAEDFRARTSEVFGLPEGEHVDFELETNKPWAGFNYYLGGLRSRVTINVDLPVLSTSLGPLVAHEAYPGHHTEHSRKEVGLVRQRHQEEETIFLVGTPQCVMAEGLADLGFEVIAGKTNSDRATRVAGHLSPLGIPYDTEVVARLGEVGESLSSVRGNAAILLHDRDKSADEVTDYLCRWSLLPRARAAKAVEFLTDPVWRAYVFCYVDGLPRCRNFAKGDPARFARLLNEQLLPADLEAA